MRRFILAAFLSLTPLPAFAQGAEITANDRSEVIEAVITHLETHYVDMAVGKSTAAKFREDLADGYFDALTTGHAFSDAVADRLQALTGDGHLNVEYFEKPIMQDDSDEDAFNAEQMERWYGSHINFGVESVKRLDSNIGYLDLRVFPPVEMGGDTFVAAMNVVANMDALIIDLRENGGGIGDTADLVASYLFGPERQQLTGIYDRPSDTLTQRFSQAYVPGARFGPDKPVYVLISKKTFSAAEALAYNLQALDRAEIVGETSGGGAHPFDYQPIHPNFVLWSVTAKSVNPVTGGNWQSVGVKPDIKAPADAALERALEDLSRLSGQ